MRSTFFAIVAFSIPRIIHVSGLDKYELKNLGLTKIIHSVPL